METVRQKDRQKLLSRSVDISDFRAVEATVGELADHFGLPNLLIHSAGDLEVGYYHQLTPRDYQSNIASNYLGGVYVTKAVLPYMVKQNSGHLVYLSSVLGRIGVLGYSAYGPAKAAMDVFADAIRMEVKPLGIQVSIIYPSDTDTPQLAYETEHLPEEIKYLKTIFTSQVNSPQVSAQAILKGIEKKREIIIPDMDGHIMDWLLRILGRRARNLLEILIALKFKQNSEHQPENIQNTPEGD
jgi:3-dehydrosphinganine reductase